MGRTEVHLPVNKLFVRIGVIFLELYIGTYRRAAKSSAFKFGPSATGCIILPIAPFVQKCIFGFEDGIAAFGSMKM